MNTFFWTSGHLGWGMFGLAVFTGLWWLAADLYWRLRNTRASRFLTLAVSGWVIGAGLIVLGFFLGAG